MACSEGLIEESLMKKLCAEVWQDEGCGEAPPPNRGDNQQLENTFTLGTEGAKRRSCSGRSKICSRRGHWPGAVGFQREGQGAGEGNGPGQASGSYSAEPPKATPETGALTGPGSENAFACPSPLHPPHVLAFSLPFIRISMSFTSSKDFTEKQGDHALRTDLCVLNQRGFLPPAPQPGDIWQCLETVLIVTTWHPSGYKLEMQLNTLQCTGQSPATKN